MATILVVDDEPRIVQLVRDYLEHGGFTVLTASDGPAALRTARTGRPDLVVLDLGLPGLDGYEVARRLRAMNHGQTFRIVAITGWGQEADRMRSKEAGFDLHLVKPVDPEELLRALRNGATVH